LSLAHLREILRGAGTGELEQARRDCATIAQLVEASEAIDWHVTRRALDVQRTSSVQPPAPADFFLALWRDFDARALLLPGLIFFRRSPEHSHKLSEILAVAGWALARFPRRAAERSNPAGTVTEPATNPPDAPGETGEPRP
jgi:hypothetical protein